MTAKWRVLQESRCPFCPTGGTGGAGAGVRRWSIISTGPLASLTCCWAIRQTLHSPPGIPLASCHYTLFYNSNHLSIFLLPFLIFFRFIPPSYLLPTTPPLKLALQINHEVLNCHADEENRGSNAKRRACLPFKASCSGIWLTLALRALTQREAEWMKGLGHFKRTHVFCQSLWLSWRSNQRAFRFKKGYFTSRPSGWLSCRRGKSRLQLKWLHLRGSDWSNRARRPREVSTSPVR